MVHGSSMMTELDTPGSPFMIFPDSINDRKLAVLRPAKSIPVTYCIGIIDNKATTPAAVAIRTREKLTSSTSFR